MRLRAVLQTATTALLRDGLLGLLMPKTCKTNDTMTGIVDLGVPAY
jgi:hypothetical protein